MARESARWALLLLGEWRPPAAAIWAIMASPGPRLGLVGDGLLSVALLSCCWRGGVT